MNQVEPRPLDPDNSTVYNTTPPETIANDVDSFGDVDSSTSSVPWPGFSYIIRSVSCGRVITLLDGQIVLAHPDGCGSIHWACVETKGWTGFRNFVSGKFLGHDKNGRLCCSAEQHKDWEYFYVRQRREGGYVLLMLEWKFPRNNLWHVGMKMEQGVENLEKISEGGSGGIVWEFVEV